MRTSLVARWQSGSSASRAWCPRRSHRSSARCSPIASPGSASCSRSRPRAVDSPRAAPWPSPSARPQPRSTASRRCMRSCRRSRSRQSSRCFRRWCARPRNWSRRTRPSSRCRGSARSPGPCSEVSSSRKRAWTWASQAPRPRAWSPPRCSPAYGSRGSAWTATRGRPLADLSAGFLFVARTPPARLIIGLFGAQTLVRGVLTVLTVVLALDLLELDQSWVGILTAALGVGGLIGASSASWLAGRSLTAPFLIGLAIWGAPIAVIGLEPSASLALGALVVVGFGDAVLDVSGYTLLQRIVPDSVLARVFGVHNAITLATVGSARSRRRRSSPGWSARGPDRERPCAPRGRRAARDSCARPRPHRSTAQGEARARAWRADVRSPVNCRDRADGVPVAHRRRPGRRDLMRRGDAGDRFYILAEAPSSWSGTGV